MNRDIERYLPLLLLLWRAVTQPFWSGLAALVDLFLRIKLCQMDIHR